MFGGLEKNTYFCRQEKRMLMEGRVSMTSLLDFIHSMSLSTSNKQWLADRLYEETRQEAATKNNEDWPRLTKEDLTISPEVMKIVEDIDPLTEEKKKKKARLEYLTKKYGL